LGYPWGMVETAELPQSAPAANSKPFRSPLPEDRINARALYIKGKGSVRLIALSLGLRFECVKNWADSEDWSGLRAEYSARELRRLIGPEPPPPQISPMPGTTPPQNISQAQRLYDQLKQIEDQMKDCGNADKLSKLANAHSKIFATWQTLTGTPNPGSRRVGKQGRQSPPAAIPLGMPDPMPAQVAAVAHVAEPTPQQVVVAPVSPTPTDAKP